MPGSASSHTTSLDNRGRNMNQAYLNKNPPIYADLPYEETPNIEPQLSSGIEAVKLTTPLIDVAGRL